MFNPEKLHNKRYHFKFVFYSTEDLRHALWILFCNSAIYKQFIASYQVTIEASEKTLNIRYLHREKCFELEKIIHTKQDEKPYYPFQCVYVLLNVFDDD